jgi:hypothetical protein
MRKISLFFLLLFFLPAHADSYQIKISGPDLVNVTAVEFKLNIDPPASYVLNKDFDLFYIPFNSEEPIALNEKILYKMADSSNLLLRFFLVEPMNVKEYLIKGNFSRANYSGKTVFDISGVDYVADFSTKFDKENLKTSLEIIDTDEVLPFLGISKAEIMGPAERIYSPEIFVTIGNIETYGFSMDEDISGLKINGVPAKLIHKQIVAASLLIDSKETREIPLVLELDVDNQHLKKEIGSLIIKEPIE